MNGDQLERYGGDEEPRRRSFLFCFLVTNLEEEDSRVPSFPLLFF